MPVREPYVIFTPADRIFSNGAVDADTYYRVSVTDTLGGLKLCGRQMYRSPLWVPALFFVVFPVPGSHGSSTSESFSVAPKHRRWARLNVGVWSTFGPAGLHPDVRVAGPAMRTPMNRGRRTMAPSANCKKPKIMCVVVICFAFASVSMHALCLRTARRKKSPAVP